MSPLSAELETMQGYPPNYPPNYGGPGKLMCFVVARGLQPAATVATVQRAARPCGPFAKPGSPTVVGAPQGR